MTNLTNYSETALLNHLMGEASFTMPSEVYLCLFTADPTDTGSLAAEVGTSRGYARLAMKASMPASSGGSAAVNTTAFTFGPCTTTNWGTVTHAGVSDSATIAAGNLLWRGALTASKVIAVGDSLVIPIGSLSVSLD